MNEYLFSDIQIGMKESFQKEITIEMEDMFRYITGDENPLHKDDGYARLCMRGGGIRNILLSVCLQLHYILQLQECTCRGNTALYIVLMKYHF